jgi:hypothetical protein
MPQIGEQTFTTTRRRFSQRRTQRTDVLKLIKHHQAIVARQIMPHPAFIAWFFLTAQIP